MTQFLKLLALTMRNPGVFLKANVRLFTRILCYLAQNPDLAWSKYLRDKTFGSSEASLLILLADKNIPVFSLLLSQGHLKNLPEKLLSSFQELNSFREKISSELNCPLQAVWVDAEIFSRINFRLCEEKNLDAFFIVAREILISLSQRLIQFSPILTEAEIVASCRAEELLGKFGPRYGVRKENPVRLISLIRGFILVLFSPLSIWRRKRDF